MTDQVIIGRTPWRNRQEPYDHSGIAKEVFDRYMTAQPAEWADQNMDKVWPGSWERYQNTGLVPEHPDPVWVIGTLVGANSIENAIAEHRLFGNEPIYASAPDRTGMREIDTPVGKQWVSIAGHKVGELLVSELIALLEKYSIGSKMPAPPPVKYTDVFSVVNVGKVTSENREVVTILLAARNAGFGILSSANAKQEGIAGKVESVNGVYAIVTIRGTSVPSTFDIVLHGRSASDDNVAQTGVGDWYDEITIKV